MAMDFEPYTPAHHFEEGKNDRKVRTKLKIASELVELAVGRSSRGGWRSLGR